MLDAARSKVDESRANPVRRCRRRKQKVTIASAPFDYRTADHRVSAQCDLKYPNCTNCEGARVMCMTYHSGKQAEVCLMDCGHSAVASS
jgi:hypothetical protein